MKRGASTFFDLREQKGGPSIDLLFPGWEEGNERVVIFFPHDDDILAGDDLTIRANRALMAPEEAEENIQKAMQEFKTQARIIEGLLAARRERALTPRLWVEVYLAFEPRPRCGYEKYLKRIRDLAEGGDLQ